MRSSIASRRSVRSELSSGEICGAEKYRLRYGILRSRLGAMQKHGTTKRQWERTKVVEYINIILWYLDSTGCMCTVAEWTTESNHEASANSRRKMIRLGGEDIYRQVLWGLFKVVRAAVLDPRSVTNRREMSAESDDSESEGDDVDANVGTDDVWEEVWCA